MMISLKCEGLGILLSSYAGSLDVCAGRNLRCSRSLLTYSRLLAAMLWKY
ncbi:hypothetical protein FG05_35074 [Fusarium graminearum]|nr:hypothetical protein FG05_35074 [Fusarium graminearum]